MAKTSNNIFSARNFPYESNIKFIAFDFEILFGRSFSSVRLVASSLSPESRQGEPFFLLLLVPQLKAVSKLSAVLFALRSYLDAAMACRGSASLPLALRLRADRKIFNFFSVFMFAQIISDGLSHAGWRNTPNTRCR